MRICLVVYELLPFGGLEEIVAALAPALRQRGQAVSVICLNWVAPENQYRRALAQARIPLVQWPRWVARLAPDWAGRERWVNQAARLLVPLAWLLAAAVLLLKRRPWPQAQASAQGWLRSRLWSVAGPDRREALGRLLLRGWAWHWRPDLLHIHGYTSFLPFVLEWACARRLPSLYEEHQTPDPQFDWWEGFKRSINTAPLVAAVSEESAAKLREVCGVTRPIVAVAPIVADPFAAGWRPSPADGSRPIQITTLARLEINKGLPYLLEAIAQVRRARPAAKFRVYGGGSLRAELLAQARQLGLDGERILAGPYPHSDLGRILAQTDIFALPSVIEGLPLVLIEAMAHARPIVATCVGGIPETVEAGVSGLLCPPADPDCLARNLTALIDDAALRARLGQAARAAYERGGFTPDAVCERFLATYRRAIAESRAMYG